MRFADAPLIAGTVEVELDDGERPLFLLCPQRSDTCRLEVYLAEKRERDIAESTLKARQIWIEAVGIGARYWGVSRDRIRESADIIGEYLDTIKDRLAAGEGLILAGPTGTGKSAIMSLIAQAAFGHARGCRYLTVTRLMRLLVDRRRNRDEDEPEYPGWQLLLLDEFGSAYEADFVFAAFEDYMGWRYDNRLTTCIATNLTPETLRKTPNYERIIDRWRETCEVVVMTGESWRKRD